VLKFLGNIVKLVSYGCGGSSKVKSIAQKVLLSSWIYSAIPI